MLHAQPAVYTVYVPNSGLVSILAWHVTYASTGAGFTDNATSPAVLGGWEVTVAFDVAHCGIYCAYRRKPDVWGRTPMLDLLLPPVVAIEVYKDSVSKPAMVIVDPAGLRVPAVSNQVGMTPEKICLPGKRLFITVRLQADSRGCTSSEESSFASNDNYQIAFPAAAPLRI